MDDCVILFEKIPFEKIPSAESTSQDLNLEDVSTIFGNPVRITSKGSMKITAEPRVAPLIITAPGPIPYSSNNSIPWNYELMSITMVSSKSH